MPCPIKVLLNTSGNAVSHVSAVILKYKVLNVANIIFYSKKTPLVKFEHKRSLMYAKTTNETHRILINVVPFLTNIQTVSVCGVAENALVQRRFEWLLCTAPFARHR